MENEWKREPEAGVGYWFASILVLVKKYFHIQIAIK